MKFKLSSEKNTFPRLCSKITSFLANKKCYPIHFEHQWPRPTTNHSHTLNMLPEWLARRLWCTKSHSLLIHFHDSPWPYRCSHCTKIWQKNYLHDIWCLIFKINTGQLCSITEIVPKSLFLCVNRSPIQYNFPAGTKVIRYSVGLDNFWWTLDLSLPE